MLPLEFFPFLRSALRSDWSTSCHNSSWANMCVWYSLSKYQIARINAFIHVYRCMKNGCNYSRRRVDRYTSTRVFKRILVNHKSPFLIRYSTNAALFCPDHTCVPFFRFGLLATACRHRPVMGQIKRHTCAVFAR